MFTILEFFEVIFEYIVFRPLTIQVFRMLISSVDATQIGQRDLTVVISVEVKQRFVFVLLSIAYFSTYLSSLVNA